MIEKFLTPDEVAKHINVKSSTVYNWLKVGHLPAFKIGGTWRISKKGLEDIIKKGMEKNCLK